MKYNSKSDTFVINYVGGGGGGGVGGSGVELFSMSFYYSSPVEV